MVDVTKNVVSLLDELITRGEQIKDACKKLYFSGAKKGIDTQCFEAWRTSCLTLLRSTFGTSSPHCDSFTNLKFFDHYNSTLLYLGILQGAREDIRKGYFYHKDLMLSVNVFNAFLLRACRLAEQGALERAAGVLDAVIAEALRKLADSHGIAADQGQTLPDAADALLRAGALPAESAERIRKFAAIMRSREAFAGDMKSFADWHEWIRAFVYEHLGSRIVIVN